MIRKWTIDEVTLALYAYCHVPFNKANNTNPWIVKIANLISRTPAAVKMKIGNLGAFDPDLKQRGVVGLTGTSRIDEEVWNKYYGNWEQLVADSQVIIGRLSNADISAVIDFPPGSEEYYQAKRRINQSFFRDAVLSSYNNRCCVTGLNNSELLEACHITSWADNESLRTDPSNGICLNPLLHAAFDNLFMSITPDYKVVFSDLFLESCTDEKFRAYFSYRNNSQIYLPDRFFPYRELLALHHEEFIQRT